MHHIQTMVGTGISEPSIRFVPMKPGGLFRPGAGAKHRGEQGWGGCMVVG